MKTCSTRLVLQRFLLLLLFLMLSRRGVVSFARTHISLWRHQVAARQRGCCCRRLSTGVASTRNSYYYRRQTLARHYDVPPLFSTTTTSSLSSTTSNDSDSTETSESMVQDDPKDDSSYLESATSSPSLRRRTLLDERLQALGINATSLHQAVQLTISNPTAGYDGAFGRSAMRTYRSFLYPKKQSTMRMDDAQLVGMAARAAQQIEFLLKRHESHQHEWVRHHDGVEQQQSRQTTFPIILLLDNLRSAFNVGSIFRTADATGCEYVVTTGITPHPAGNGAEKVAKSALGADRVVPSRHFGTTAEAIAWLRQEHGNYQIMGLETTTKSRCYTQVDFPAHEGVVICLGNEVTGLDTAVMPLLDDLLEIPMFGTKNSLNVASCAPIVLYEIVRQWTTSNNKPSPTE